MRVSKFQEIGVVRDRADAIAQGGSRLLPDRGREGEFAVADA
jgi:hypothetical protein